MKQYWEQLKPLERRWAVAIGGLIFLLLNYFFIWPHFKDWNRDKLRIFNAEEKIKTYQKEVALKNVYETKLRILQAEGDEVLTENQAIDFVHFYSSRMLSNHVLLLNGGTLTTSSNQFFTQQQLGINVQADETNLVNFLYSLGAGNSMVSVRAMNLHPAPGQRELNAGITMVASYKKIAPARTGAAKPVKNTVAPSSKPTTPAATPPPRPANQPPVPINKTTSPGNSKPSATNKPGPSIFKKQ